MKKKKCTLIILIIFICISFLSNLGIKCWSKHNIRQSVFFSWCGSVVATDIENANIAYVSTEQNWIDIPLTQQDKKKLALILNSIPLKDIELGRRASIYTPDIILYLYGDGYTYAFDCYMKHEPYIYLAGDQQNLPATPSIVSKNNGNVIIHNQELFNFISSYIE